MPLLVNFPIGPIGRVHPNWNQLNSHLNPIGPIALLDNFSHWSNWDSSDQLKTNWSPIGPRWFQLDLQLESNLDLLKPINTHCDQLKPIEISMGFQLVSIGFSSWVDFYLKWLDYKYGFGNVGGEHWLGNDKIHRLTSQKTYKLRVDLADFDGATRYAEYDEFLVADEDLDYQLTLGNYGGTAGETHFSLDFRILVECTFSRRHMAATLIANTFRHRFCCQLAIFGKKYLINSWKFI